MPANTNDENIDWTDGLNGKVRERGWLSCEYKIHCSQENQQCLDMQKAQAEKCGWVEVVPHTYITPHKPVNAGIQYPKICPCCVVFLFILGTLFIIKGINGKKG
jgi:hypothetical protein